MSERERERGNIEKTERVANRKRRKVNEIERERERESGRKNAIEEYRVQDSKVDERVGSHVDVKDRNCEFVDPRVE